MKNKITVLLFVLTSITFSRCLIGNNRALSENDLPSQHFTVAVDKDTVLHTAKGALIKIPAGALNANGATTVTLEVKEAFSMTDIVKGGLMTKNGNLLLSSGGMIYINPLDRNVTLTKPISVSIPTDYQQPGMQLYKGEKKNDGTIDWTNPQPLPQQKLSEHLQKSKNLYTSNCRSCHDPLKDATGPGIAFLDKRRDKKWLADWIHNSSALIASGDKYANALYCKWGKTQMTAFPTLNDSDIQAIFDYADYEASNIDPATIPDDKVSFDSCKLYDSLSWQLVLKRQQLIYDNDPQVVYIDTDTVFRSGNSKIIVDGPDNQVVVNTYQSVYYQFEINTFGWYNVDVIVGGLPGLENSNLTVTLTGKYIIGLNIFLIVPAERMCVPGGPAAGKDNTYAFLGDEGKIPLVQNVQAYILAMNEDGDNLYFGKTSFTTSLNQSLEIQLEKVTKEQMNAQIDKLGIDKLGVRALDSKNAGKIRKIDVDLKKIDNLKPRNIDCHCTPSDSIEYDQVHYK